MLSIIFRNGINVRVSGLYVRIPHTHYIQLSVYYSITFRYWTGCMSFVLFFFIHHLLCSYYCCVFFHVVFLLFI